LFLLLSPAHLTLFLQHHTPVPLVPPRNLRRGYPSLKGEAFLRFRTPYYRHQLMLATCAMGLNGLAGPLELSLAGLYARRLSLLWSGIAHITIAHHFSI
jgi:hypothetical protein